MAERMDRLIAVKKIRPMIMVMPDCFTYYGGSQYINSTATGNYEDYLTQEIVPFVDANLRTINHRDARASAGVSSGGYGSLIMGLRHADIFGLICSHAGDAYFQYAQLADFPQAIRAIKGDVKAFLERFWREEKKDMKDFAGFNAIGMAACYSPNGTDFDMPFDLETGELRQDVFDRWLEHDPVFLVEKYVENLKSLRLLYLDAGKRDDFSLDIGARILCKRFRDHAIDFIHEEFDDGHMGIAYRYDRSLELISSHIETI
jgi:enterochelin esterase family protein